VMTMGAVVPRGESADPRAAAGVRTAPVCAEQGEDITEEVDVLSRK
jgi:hypothetical protein